MRAQHLGILLISLSLGLVGCANDVDEVGDAPPELEEGLTVLQAEEGGLSLAYRRADVVIYLQALRGRATAPEYQQDPLSPKFEVDARMTDDQGYIFYSQQGGDAWLDPVWAEDLERQIDDRPEADDNRVLFELAGEAAAVLRESIAAQVGPTLAEALEPEIHALHTFGVRAPSLYAEQHEVMNDMLRARDLPVLEPTPDGDVAYGSDKGGNDSSPIQLGSGYYYLALHEAGISGTLGIGRHSSTALYRWQSAWVHVHNTCNHGRCGTEMSRECFFQYYEAVNDYHPSWALRSCSTPYDTFSDGGGHNCHDDSRVQMHNFIFDSTMGGTQQWCNGRDDDTDISSWPGDQSGHPECSSSGRRGYGFSP
ncbi:MAG: hypothetical protein RLP09_36595 [Sandaracinaceae bacterium]